MQILWFLTFLIIIIINVEKFEPKECSTCENYEELTHENQEELIANGELYNLLDYPYVVLIRFKSKPGVLPGICTGSLVSSHYVLTAAHCTEGKEESTILVYREVRVTPNTFYQYVNRIYQHHEFNSSSLHADISLLKLQGSFDNVEYFTVLSGDPSDFINNTELKNCVAIGFGVTEQGSQDFEIIGHVIQTRIKYGPKACKPYPDHNISEEYHSPIWSELLCSNPNKQMVCKGDSGGPLICNGFQYGVTSHAYNFKDISNVANIACGNPDIQTTHIFIYVYKDWIHFIVENAGINVIPGQKLNSFITIFLALLNV